jgi:hypothetical protein
LLASSWSGGEEEERDSQDDLNTPQRYRDDRWLETKERARGNLHYS